MTKTEFVLAVALLIIVGYLVLPERVTAQIREEVARGIQAAKQQEQIAEAEEWGREFFERHPELLDDNYEAHWSGLESD